MISKHTLEDFLELTSYCQFLIMFIFVVSVIPIMSVVLDNYVGLPVSNRGNKVTISPTFPGFLDLLLLSY